MTQSQIPPWLLTPDTRHLIPFIYLRGPDLMEEKHSKNDAKNAGGSGDIYENKGERQYGRLRAPDSRLFPGEGAAREKRMAKLQVQKAPG